MGIKRKAVDLRLGDSRELPKDLEENSVDGVVTDPPYGLEFMGKEWDKINKHFSPAASGNYPKSRNTREVSYESIDKNATQLWHQQWATEIYRVLKPGGYMLVFGGTRTYHRMACAVEDAGFEIRDTISWNYGTGFPKSTNVGKAIDKQAGKEREKVGEYERRSLIDGANRQSNGDTGVSQCAGRSTIVPITQPATEAAKKWDGWGTALKPAHELILIARKSFSEKTVAANILKWGTGGINVDGCRIGGIPGDGRWGKGINKENRPPFSSATGEYIPIIPNSQGRWPANFLLSHSEGCVRRGEKKVKPAGGDIKIEGKGAGPRENQVFGQDDRPRGEWVAYKDPNGLESVEDWDCVEGCPIKELDEQSGHLHGSGNKKDINIGKAEDYNASSYHLTYKGRANRDHLGQGGASRFFYCAKASRGEREEGLKGQLPCVKCGEKDTDFHKDSKGNKVKCVRNDHPTVKPVKVLQYLCRLITQPGGTVLDPFMGSGSTGLACIEEGFRFIGFELEEGSMKISKARVRHAIVKKLKSIKESKNALR